MSYLIDTSILIEIENNNKEVINQIEKLPHVLDLGLQISLFTFTEFYYGLVNKIDKNKNKYLERLGKYKVFNPTHQTSIIFCEIVHNSQQNGNPIAQFDAFIAATALQHSMTLITLDKNFSKVDKLKTIILHN
ncbi:PIN domain-containing protein [Candidatus Woesearchaeota archaeon]|nr:PIN domain-containing protein [Candidatus Woesearchaeota archaeon]